MSTSPVTRQSIATVHSDPNSTNTGATIIPTPIAPLQNVTAPPLEGRINVIDIPKLENSEVFNSIKSKMCLIEGPKGKGSGFFINENGLLVTTFHCLTITYIDGGGRFSVNPDELSVTYNEKKYKVQFPPDFDASKAQQLDLCLLQIKSPASIKTSCFELLPRDIPIMEGMKTYFAGFPLTQSIITCHKGLISSIFQANQIQYFTIDGTVVPGNSGGPVVIQHQGSLYLAGIIFAEAADINPDFLQQKQSIITTLQEATVQVSGVYLNRVLAHAVDTMFKNMSTGIGKAIHVQHISGLLSNQTSAFFLIGPEQSTTLDSDLPVVHGTLKVATTSREKTKKVSKSIIKNAINFINSFDKPAKKEELYAQLWGSIGTIYFFEGGRLDRQSPGKNATNLQIQVGEDTIATLIIDDKLSRHSGDNGKISEVVNYVVRQFISALNYYKNHGEAIVLQISPRT